MDSFSLLEPNALVRRSLEQCLPNEYWIQTELSDVRSNTTGHCCLEFVQRDSRSNSLVARARGMIRSDIYHLLKLYSEETTEQLFVPGTKVLMKVTVQFHEFYDYSLTVLDINPTCTLGDMACRRREILMQLEEEGVLTSSKELEVPAFPQRTAIISSVATVGYGDFCHQLQHNSGGFFFYTKLFPALMWDDQMEEFVLTISDCINDRVSEFDVAVIIRDGGTTLDLSGFDTYPLAAARAQLSLPVIVGISHGRDDIALDSVAHTWVRIPTAAAELLTHRITESADHLEELSARPQQGTYALLEQEGQRLEMTQARIPNLVHRKLTDVRFALLAVGRDLAQATQTLLPRHRHQLELLRQRVVDAFPDRLLGCGYSITLRDGKAVTDAASLNPEDQLVIHLAKGGFTSEVRLDEYYHPS